MTISKTRRNPKSPFRSNSQRHAEQIANSSDQPSNKRFPLEWLSPDALRPDPENPRKHSRQQVRKLQRDMRKHGCINPLLVTKDNVVVAGHARLEAAKLAGLTEIPIIRLQLTEAEAKARNIWDNRASDFSSFDGRLLGLRFQALENFDIDLEETGFSVGEIDFYISNLESALDEDIDPEDLLPSTVAVTRPGDVWILGRHRLFCGDAQKDASYVALLKGTQAHAAFTDVPYNLAPQYISGKGKIRHDAFKMGSGELSGEAYERFLSTAFERMVAHSVDGAAHFQCIDWRHVFQLHDAAEPHYGRLLNVCIWVKPNGGMGSFYRSRHELVLVYRCGSAQHRNNVELGRNGRNRTNVWEFAGNTSFSGRSTDEGNLLDLHPTVKPVQMIVEAILDCTAPGEIVLDPFVGSGSTVIAAERARRRCCGMDIDPRYVDVAIRRWQRHTGGHAVLESTGQTFDAIAVGPSTGRVRRPK